jgi:hypothetical protein
VPCIHENQNKNSRHKSDCSFIFLSPFVYIFTLRPQVRFGTPSQCSNDRTPHGHCDRLKQIQNVPIEHGDFQIGLAVLINWLKYKNKLSHISSKMQLNVPVGFYLLKITSPKCLISGFPPWCKLDLRSSRMLRSIDW